MFWKKLFGKTEEEKTNFVSEFTLKDIKKGFILDYFMQSWEVTEHYEYNWGNNFTSNEFTLDNGKEKIFLHIEDDDELKCMISRETSLPSLNPALKSNLKSTGKPIPEIAFKDTNYVLEKEFSAQFKKYNAMGWSSFSGWEFYDASEEKFISINDYGNNEYEAYYGHIVKEYEFSNFLKK